MNPRGGRAFAVLLCAAGFWTSAAAGDFKLGVQTHFSQGWPEALFDQVKTVKAQGLRDSVPWTAGEREAGDYDFSSLDFDGIRTACDNGQDLVLTLVPVNKIYDDGDFVHTDVGRAAFVAYVDAVLNEFGTCVAAIEVGNEINTANAFKGPAAKDKYRAYTALIRTVHDQVKSQHAGVAILGGSTNVVGVGFLEKLFDAGMLTAIDGVVVHPYRRKPEGLEVELDRLKAAMKRAGVVKPIWATEFSDDFKTPQDAAPFLIKMVTIMSAANVERAYWYALIDQKWFPAMGLFDIHEDAKPAAAAFIAAQTLLLPSGRARRIDPSDPLVRLYRFGDGRFVIWGATRAISVAQGTAWNSKGEAIGLPSTLSDDPVILSADATWTLGAPGVLADTLYQYGEAPFSYAAERGGEKAIPLEMIDWNWTSYWGTKETAPLRVNIDSLAVAGDRDEPVRVRLRYTPAARGAFRVQVCADKADKGDGMDIEIRAGAKTLVKGHLTTEWSAVQTFAKASPADIVFGPHDASGGDAARYRVRILPPEGEAPAC